MFSPVNTAIYAISMEQEMDDGDSTYDSSFKTVDAIDYSSIGMTRITEKCKKKFITLCFISATIDVKKGIYDLAINRYDTQIALIENQGMFNSVQESVVRVYDVGRRRDDEDEQVRKPTVFSEELRKPLSSSPIVIESFHTSEYLFHYILRSLASDDY